MKERSSKKRARVRWDFVAWYEDGRKNIIINTLGKALMVFLLVGCIAVAYLYQVKQIGNGAYTYSDEIYEHIEATIAEYVTPEAGIQSIPLQETLDKYYSSYENEKTKLQCIIENGFFKAVVTAIISKEYEISEPQRNFTSHEQYMEYFWFTLGWRFFAMGISMWFLLISVWKFGLFIAYKLEIRARKKQSEKEKIAQEGETKSEEELQEGKDKIVELQVQNLLDKVVCEQA